MPDYNSDYYKSLQFLLDKNAIEEGLVRYTRCMDRCDWELCKNIFVPNAPAHYGMYFDGTFEGFCDYVHDYHYHNTYCRQHRIFNITITIAPDGQTAASESYLMVTLRERFIDGKQGIVFDPILIKDGTKPDGTNEHYYQGQLVDTVGYGRYLDSWVKQPDGKWRIAERTYNLDFGHQQAITSPTDTGRHLGFPGAIDDDPTTPANEHLDYSYGILFNDYLLAQ